MADPKLYTTGGTVQAGGGIYIPRPADKELLQLCRNRAFAYVLTPRQMGKSSLMIQTAQQLEAEGVRTAIVDLQDLGAQVTAEQWYFGFLVKLEDQLVLDTDVVSWWQAHHHLGVSQRLTLFFERVLLAEIPEPLVIFVDEIDSTLSLDFTDDFFTAIRYLYVSRAQIPEFQRLSFVLIGVATPSDLIRDPRRTPFNIGQRVDLQDFTLSEALPLAVGLGLTGDMAEQTMAWVLQWTGGHPYLTQRLCQEMAQAEDETWSGAKVGRLVEHTFLGEHSERDNNLQFVRDMLTKRAPELGALLETYRQVRRGKPPVVDEEQSLVKSHLKLSGLVKRQGRVLLVRNLIYRQVFDRRWVREHLPESLWQRLKPAMPIIATLSGALLLVSSFAVYARQQQALAERQVRIAKIARLRGQAATAKSLLSIPSRQVDGMVLAIQATGESRQGNVSEVFAAVDDSLLHAVQTVRERNSFLAHREGVSAMAVTPDGQTIVTGGNHDGTVRLWNQDGRPIGQPLQTGSSRVNSVAITSDGQTIVVGDSSRANPVRWLNQDGEAIDQLLQAGLLTAESVAITPDGQTTVVGGRAVGVADRTVGGRSSRSTVRVLNQDGKAIGQPFQGHSGEVTSIAITPDGQTIVSGDGDGTVRLWSQDGSLIGQPLPGHAASVSSVTVTADGQTIVSGGADGTVRLWNRDGSPIGQPLPGHAASVSSVAVTADGQTIVSGGEDGTVRLWSRDGSSSSSIGQPLPGHSEGVSSVAVTADGQTIISSGGDGTVRLWNREALPIGKPFRDQVERGIPVWVSADGQTVSTWWDGTERVWDRDGIQIDPSVEPHPLLAHRGSINTIAVTEDGQRIVRISEAVEDSAVQVWSREGEPISEAFTHLGVQAVAITPDGQTIVSGGADKSVRLWTDDGTPIGQPFEGHEVGVYSVDITPDGQTIVSGGNDGTVRLWNRDGTPIGQPFQGYLFARGSRKVHSVRITADGQTIVSGGVDGTMRLWNRDGTPIGQPFSKHRVDSLAVTPDGQTLVSVGEDGTIWVWEGSWQGWLRAACNQLRNHFVFREPDKSFDPEAARGARRVCEEQVWQQEE
ncbi:AAA-like domain-containing protein [Nodosilinea sp. P-1105]|uniref:AAA-like domain-containing protein n=1 Tax=Nodosilinea sp. P-1105 TaxID=2546229 RepID=UPI00146D650D|nr:AAA-like domain-containing protein [Nodosilinea sp. P-1105]